MQNAKLVGAEEGSAAQLHKNVLGARFVLPVFVTP